MKKTITLIISVISIILITIIPVKAADFDLVADGVGILTDDEYIELNELAQDITDRHKCELSIVVIEDKGDDDILDFAKFVYNEYDYGYGADKSGLMLMLSMKERDYVLLAYGYGNVAFTDYGKEVLLDKHLLPLLSDDEYYSAFSTYLGKTDEFLEMARNGQPFDSGLSPWVKWLIVIFIPLLIGGGVSLFFLGQMKSADLERAADLYIPVGGLNLTMQADNFLYRTETRRKLKDESSSKGTSVDSDGSSSSKGSF